MRQTDNGSSLPSDFNKRVHTIRQINKQMDGQKDAAKCINYVPAMQLLNILSHICTTVVKKRKLMVRKEQNIFSLLRGVNSFLHHCIISWLAGLLKIGL